MHQDGAELIVMPGLVPGIHVFILLVVDEIAAVQVATSTHMVLESGAPAKLLTLFKACCAILVNAAFLET